MVIQTTKFKMGLNGNSQECLWQRRPNQRAVTYLCFTNSTRTVSVSLAELNVQAAAVARLHDAGDCVWLEYMHTVGTRRSHFWFRFKTRWSFTRELGDPKRHACWACRAGSLAHVDDGIFPQVRGVELSPKHTSMHALEAPVLKSSMPHCRRGICVHCEK